jgi:hypothetical protein
MLNSFNHMNNSTTCGGEKAMTKYPGAKHNDCDHYDHKKCKEPRAKKKNGGMCNGHKTDCIWWELTH